MQFNEHVFVALSKVHIGNAVLEILTVFITTQSSSTVETIISENKKEGNNN